MPIWLGLVSLACCTGALVCRLWVLETSHTAAIPYYNKLLVGISRFFGIAIAVLTASSVSELLARTAEMSGVAVRSAPGVVPIVITKTHYGHLWLISAMALSLLWIAWLLGKRYRDSRSLAVFMLCLDAVFAFSISATGHASDAGDFSVAEIADWFHLIAAAVWGGGLIVLSTVILPKITGPDNRKAAIIAGIARRFSTIAGIFVGVVAITALYNSWYFIGSLAAFSGTPYGLAAAAKIIFLCVLLFLGAFNRYINVALLQQWAGLPLKKETLFSRLTLNLYSRLTQSREGLTVAFRFMGSVKIEACLVVIVMLLAAFLRHDIPARHMAHFEHPGEGPASHSMHDGNDEMQHHGYHH